MLFTGKFKINGKLVTRPALAEIAKLGWTWILDRETGKPLTQVKQVKVPVSKAPGRELLADAADPRRPQCDRRPTAQGWPPPLRRR